MSEISQLIRNINLWEVVILEIAFMFYIWTCFMFIISCSKKCLTFLHLPFKGNATISCWEAQQKWLARNFFLKKKFCVCEPICVCVSPPPNECNLHTFQRKCTLGSKCDWSMRKSSTPPQCTNDYDLLRR